MGQGLLTQEIGKTKGRPLIGSLVEHQIQLVNYLKGMKREIGLLINFSPSGVDLKRESKEFDMEG